MERITLTAGGARREYLLFAPAGRGPLVVFLHGMGATAEWADDETGWSALAAREGFALAVPQALPPHPDQPPKFLTNPPKWQDATGDEDVAFLAAVMDDAAARAGADPRRVCVAGFSNGAAMAFRAAAELAERVAAVAPVAGHCRVPDPRPTRPVPTLYAVGSADPLVPLRGGEVRNPWRHRYVRRPPVVETLEKWARAIGCETIARTEAGPGGARVETFPGPVPFRSVVIEGLGHHWPGGRGRFNHRIAGPVVATVNGTELVWEFFEQNAAPQPAARADVHRIRLGSPWEVVAEGGRMRHTRNFGRPRTLGPAERVWLVCDSLPGDSDVTVNGQPVGKTPASGPFAADITGLLCPRNTILIATPSGGRPGGVVLEIRPSG